MLVDSRNKQATFYPKNGASEVAAIHAIEGAVQAQRYQASVPILYKVEDVPTYMSSLKDVSENLKGVALMAVDDRSIIGIGDDVASAMRNYEDKLHRRNTALAYATVKTKSTVQGTITRLEHNDNNGHPSVYLMLDTIHDRIFAGASSPDNLPLMLARIGDKVTIQYLDTNSEVEDIQNFKNDNITLRQSASQKKMDDR